MSNIIEIKKSIIIKYEEREKRLPEKLKEKIEKFWKNMDCLRVNIVF